MTDRRFATLAAVCAAVVIGVPLGIIRPTTRAMSDTSATIYHEYEFLEERRQQGQNIQRARADYQAAQPIIAPLQGMALAPGDELALIKTFESLADQLGLPETLRLDPSPAPASADYQAIAFTLTLRGSYAAIVRYLVALRGLPLVTNLTAITMTSSSQTSLPATAGGATVVEARLTGSAYQYLTAPQP